MLVQKKRWLVTRGPRAWTAATSLQDVGELAHPMILRCVLHTGERVNAAALRRVCLHTDIIYKGPHCVHGPIIRNRLLGSLVIAVRAQ